MARDRSAKPDHGKADSGEPSKGKSPGAEKFLPERRGLSQLREAVQDCEGCDLYKRATQAVFGEGSAKARIMLVGEQPGDREDVQGHPFVGPAGLLLDRALKEAGIARGNVFVTNVVKHFKSTPAPRGKKRIHSKPSAREMKACRPLLEAELGLVKPVVLVLLGATAAQSLLEASFRVTKSRGKAIEGTRWAKYVVATVHPSSILRAPDDEERHRQFAAFVKDLKVAAKAAKNQSL